MRRVFNAVRQKDLTPYFSCIGRRTKGDCKKESNLKDNCERVTIASRTDLVNFGTNHQSFALEPPDPTSCCGSGCANCIWIEYAAELVRHHGDRPLNEVLDEIDRVVPNTSVREFVKAEIRSLTKCQ